MESAVWTLHITAPARSMSIDVVIELHIVSEDKRRAEMVLWIAYYPLHISAYEMLCCKVCVVKCED